MEQAVYDIFSYDTEKEVTVTLLKLSEAGNSILGIDEITVTAPEDIAPTAEKDLRLEFTKAYAYETAQLLDADYSLVSYSGNGIVSGYTSQGVKVLTQLLPEKYERFAISSGKGLMGFTHRE